MRMLAIVAVVVACEKPPPAEPVVRTRPDASLEPPPLEPQPTPPVEPPVATLPEQELAEVRAILDGKGTFDPKRAKALDPSWDPSRVWLRSWKQRGRDIQLIGESESLASITQFVRRLAGSVYFADVVSVRGDRLDQSYEFEVHMKAPKADPDAPLLTETFTRPGRATAPR